MNIILGISSAEIYFPRKQLKTEINPLLLKVVLERSSSSSSSSQSASDLDGLNCPPLVSE
jgi:hypothetical protein